MGVGALIVPVYKKLFNRSNSFSVTRPGRQAYKHAQLRYHRTPIGSDGNETLTGATRASVHNLNRETTPLLRPSNTEERGAIIDNSARYRNTREKKGGQTYNGNMRVGDQIGGSERIRSKQGSME